MKSSFATWFGFLSGCLLAAVAEGGLVLVDDSLAWDRTSSSTSPSFTVGIDNNSVTTSMVGWQLTLGVSPKAGATGTLEFASGAAPADYVLQGVGDNFNPDLNNKGFPTGLVRAADNDDSLSGLVVPATGKNLLSFTLSTPDGATGDFEVFAQPGMENSFWYGTGLGETPFDALPFSGGEPLSLGTITVTPEPGSLLLAGLGLFGALGCGALEKRRRSSRRGRRTHSA